MAIPRLGGIPQRWRCRVMSSFNGRHVAYLLVAQVVHCRVGDHLATIPEVDCVASLLVSLVGIHRLYTLGTQVSTPFQAIFQKTLSMMRAPTSRPSPCKYVTVNYA